MFKDQDTNLIVCKKHNWEQTKECIYCLCEELQSENSALRERLSCWETEISQEMPVDFKDWWKNNKEEWPLVARLVLEQRRSRIEELETDSERLKVDKKELAEQSNLFRRQRNEALNEVERKDKIIKFIISLDPNDGYNSLPFIDILKQALSGGR